MLTKHVAGISVILITMIIIVIGWWVMPVLKPFPPLTGAYNVGITSIELIDEDRTDPYAHDEQKKRYIYAHIWYPTDNHTHASKKSSYLGNRMSLLEKMFAQHYNVPEVISTLLWSNITTHALLNARISSKKSSYPIVLFSHGLFGTPSDMYTGLLEELASHGYIVVGLDHPYFNWFTQYTNGKIATSIPLSNAFEKMSPSAQQQFQAEAIATYIADMQFVLNKLNALNKDPHNVFHNRFDFNRIGIIGHSAGGTAAIELCRIDERIKACVDLDGWYDHIIGHHPINTPLLLIWAEKTLEISEPTLEYLQRKQLTRQQYFERVRRIEKHQQELCQESRSCSSVVIPRATHGDFGDLMLLKWPVRSWNEVDGYKTLEFISKHITQFFNNYLEQNNTPLLHNNLIQS